MIIYKITNLLNGKCYIGQTIFSIEVRKKRHIRDSKKHSLYPIHRALSKDGIDNFKWEELERCDCKASLDVTENLKIIEHHSHISEGGYNLTWGGEGCSGYKHTDDMKKYISERQIGPKNHRYDKKLSSEMRDKFVYSRKGKKATLDTKKRMSENHSRYWLGKHSTKEAIEKMVEGVSKEWLLKSPEGNAFQIKNLSSFCRENNLSSSALVQVAKGNYPAYKGWSCNKVVK